MKYKLLAKNGQHFVCLEDGTKLPMQITSVVQHMREAGKAFCHSEISVHEKEQILPSEKSVFLRIGNHDSRLTFKPNLSDIELFDIHCLSLRLIAISNGFFDYMVEFLVHVDIVDTVEAPILR